MILSENTGTKTYLGGVVGRNNTTLESCYYLKDSAEYGDGYNKNDNNTSRNEYEKMISDEFLGNLGTKNWKIISGRNNGYPLLSWE